MILQSLIKTVSSEKKDTVCKVKREVHPAVTGHKGPEMK